MNRVIYHFVSGEAFFSGAALVALSAALAVTVRRRWARIAARLAAIVGLLFAALSATPFPLWLYALWSALVLAWLIAQALSAPPGSTAALAVAAALLSVGLAAVELPHHICPTVPPGGYDAVHVLGDSISSGLASDERTWPAVLADRLRVPVVNLAAAGATAESA